MATTSDSPAIAAARPRKLTLTMKRLAAYFLLSHSRKSPSHKCDSSTVAAENDKKLNNCCNYSANKEEEEDDDDLDLLLAHAEATLGELLAKAGASFDDILAEQNKQCKSVDGDSANQLGEAANQSVTSDDQHSNYDELCHDYRHVRRTSSFSRLWKQLGERIFCGCSSAQLRCLVQEMEMELSRSAAMGGAPLSAQAQVYFQEEDDIEAYWRSVAESMLNGSDAQDFDRFDGKNDADKSLQNSYSNVSTTESEITSLKPAPMNSEVSIRKTEKRVTFLLDKSRELQHDDVQEINVVTPASAAVAVIRQHELISDGNSGDGVYSDVKLQLDRVSSRRMNTQLDESPVLSQSRRYRALQGSSTAAAASPGSAAPNNTINSPKNGQCSYSSRGGMRFNASSLSPAKLVVSFKPWPGCRRKASSAACSASDNNTRQPLPVETEPVLPYGANDRSVQSSDSDEAPQESSRGDEQDVVREMMPPGGVSGTGRSVPLMVLLHEEKEESTAEYSDEETCMSLFACASGAEKSAGIEEIDAEEEDDGEGEGEGGSGNVRRTACIGADPLVCCVCMVGRKGAALIPCGHTFCRSCTQHLFVERGACPLCNSLIAQVLHIF